MKWIFKIRLFQILALFGDVAPAVNVDLEGSDVEVGLVDFATHNDFLANWELDVAIQFDGASVVGEEIGVSIILLGNAADQSHKGVVLFQIILMILHPLHRGNFPLVALRVEGLLTLGVHAACSLVSRATGTFISATAVALSLKPKGYSDECQH